MSFSIKTLLKRILILVILTITGCIGLFLRIISFGYLINFNRKYFFATSSKLILFIAGVKLVVPKENPIKEGKSLITFNHNSYLDLFALSALGYTNMYFLLSERTIKFIPFTISALSIGVIYIPQKKHLERRMKFFHKLEERIIKENLNIAGAPEGSHDWINGIGSFNKGIFHMATLCKQNIIPMFIYIPEESNPLDKYQYFKRGTIQIEMLPVIDTQNWKLEDLVTNKEFVRSIYVKKYNEIHKTNVV